MGCEVRFRILGSLDVSVDGSPVVVSAARQRALLARLLLDANRSLHPDVLIETIWGDAIPQHPDAALQIVVSRLRSALGAAAGRLTSGPAGYRLEVADDEVDHLRARRTFCRAQELWEENDFAAAAAAADTALACWTGDAGADLGGMPFYDTAYAELRELRLAIYELRNRAYFQCGRHVEILADIGAWISADPWRERLRTHQMLALYRAGRRVEALAVYEDLRICLADELGVEPSTYVHDLYARIRDQDPTLVAPRAGIVGALPSWTPCSLPFVGRSREESIIFERLRDVAGGARRMILVEGEAGIGKTRLALEIARRAHDAAIVLPVDGADALRPGLQMIAAGLAEACSHLGETELRLSLGRWPGDLAEMVPALRGRLPDLPPALDADDETRAIRMREAVVSWIGALSQRAPVLLLLDDVHRAGPALLVLLGALMVAEKPSRVLVLATARSATERSARLEQLAHRLDQLGLLERLELGGLTSDSVHRLLTELACPDASTLSEDLTRVTSGHPYLLGEMLRESDCGAVTASDDDVTARIRQFVLRRVAALGEPGARLLGIAAEIDGEFDVALLTELAHGTEQSTEALLDRAIDGGLLHVTGLGSFDFAHDLARRAIAESSDPEGRSVVHRDIAEALERRRESAARIAAHWSLVADADADGSAQAWAERAGDEALRDLDSHAAAGWFELAAERATDARARAHVLVRLAEAQCRSGDKAGADTLRAALEIVRSLDDADLLVEAATVWAPIWSSMPTLTQPERIELLNEAASGAPAGSVRARLRARLATELTSSEWARAKVLADEALDEVREHDDDDDAWPEVCMRHFQATGAPHNLDERRAYMAEMVAATEVAQDPIQRFFVLTMSAAAAVEAAELDEADAYLDRAFAIARSAGVPVLSYNAECVRVWRTGLAGDLEEAERLAYAAMKIGQRSGIEYAIVGPGMQLGSIRWQLGRFADLLPLLRVTTKSDDVAASILLAKALSCTPESRAEAVEVLARAAANDFADLPRNMHWAGALVAAAEIACTLGDDRIARTVRALLEPFADRVAFNGVWVIAPIAYGVAVAAAAAGESTADGFFEQSIDLCNRMRAPMLRARTEMAWSHVLQARAEGSASPTPLTFVEHRIEPVAGSADAFCRRAGEALAALR
jgi:DNA-binding SARP family transcriptional activator